MEAKRFNTVSDLLNLPESSRAELIDGKIVEKALPGGEHAKVEGAIAFEISKYFRKKSRDDGTGGWWILPEVTIYYPALDRALVADIAGWRRERIPEIPKGYPVRERPDWICEVSHTTWKKDTTTVFETLLAEGVPYYWVVDVERKNLLVYELIEKKYALIQSLFLDSGRVKIKPFDTVELNVSVLLGEAEE